MKVDLMTTKQVAKKLGIHHTRVSKIAKNRGVEPALIAGSSHLWQPRDVERLRPGPRGRPRNPDPN